MSTVTTTQTELMSKDYFINYYGQVIDIKNTKSILCLHTMGSGFTDDLGYYTGGSSYDLYIPNKKDFGETLIKIGSGRESWIKGDVACTFQIGNQSEVTIDGFDMGGIFKTIMKRSK